MLVIEKSEIWIINTPDGPKIENDFNTIMDKYFEGYNVPFKWKCADNFKKAYYRVKEYLKEKKPVAAKE